MHAAAIVTLVLVGILIAALAVYLIVIIVALRKTSQTLGTVVLGVRAIAHRTEPLAAMIEQVADDVIAIDEALHSLASGDERAAS